MTATFDVHPSISSLKTDVAPTPLSIATPSEIYPSNYVVQSGDTLLSIAQRFNLPISSLIELNRLPNPNLLMVGQIIQLPNIPSIDTSVILLIPDKYFVYDDDFNVEAFLNTQQGWLKIATDQIDLRQSDGSVITEVWKAHQIITYYAERFSIDARIMLTLLELRSSGLTQSNISPSGKLYPLGNVDPNREGLTRQVNWAYDQLNAGYYGWLYRGLNTVTSSDTQYRIRFHIENNAASIAIQYITAQVIPYDVWADEIANKKFRAVYEQYFRELPINNIPIERPVEQPVLALPFAQDERWYFTGGAHGGWGGGSEWAAIDLAPPDETSLDRSLCYVSAFPIRAVGDGIIARSDHGRIVLDLDHDGNIATGWNILYLHVDMYSRLVKEGDLVQQGDPLGYTACEGGFSTATHLHIARLYNGEWIPADCGHCQNPIRIPSMKLGQWRVQSVSGQEYQGFLLGMTKQLTAEQGRLSNINHLTW